MRIAVLVIALASFLIMAVQSCAVYMGGELIGDTTLAEGGSIGLAASILFVIGAGFVMPLPIVSVVVFGLITLVTLSVAATSDFVDLYVWGSIAGLLCVLSMFGTREGKAPTAKIDAASTPFDLPRDEPLREPYYPPATPQGVSDKEPDEPASEDLESRLTRLKALYEQGALDDEEYRNQRARLIEAIIGR